MLFFLDRPVKLLGSTAIDDKLQDEVPETIEQLRLAGVRVPWTLSPIEYVFTSLK